VIKVSLALGFSFESQKLLSESKVLEQKVALGAKKTNDQTEQKPE